MGRPRKQSGNRIFQAKESFAVELDGASVVITAGRTRVREGHPLMAGREQYFEELSVDYDVEQATDSPGEKRGEKRGK